MEGLTARLTSDGVPVLRAHYASDPDKRPGTPEGDRWLANALIGVVGGKESARWRREMEIDYGALGGTLVFPRWQVDKRRLCPPPISDPQGLLLYGSYDHGWRNPATYLVLGQDRDGCPIVLWQFYASGVGVRDIARIVKGETVRVADGRTFTGNPFWAMTTTSRADPSIWKEDQNMDDGTTKSVAELFRRYGVYFQEGKRGGDTTVASWLTELWQDLNHPGCRICCPPSLQDVDQGFISQGYAGYGAPALVWEIGRLRFKDWSEQQAIHHDYKEEIEDKDNHAWDALKMHLHAFPPKAPASVPSKQAGSIDWWREQRKRAQQGMAPRTFSVGM
jgi:hypothetical protein